MLKNLKANPISRRPKTTFTVLSQPPDEGSELSHPGNALNSINGIESAIEKPNMTAVGAANDPVAAPAKAPPISGPVQEKETIANVAAIKKIPIIPPLSEAASALFAQLWGNWISKAPKKLIPKINNRMNSPTLKKGSVEITFIISTPNIAVSASPRPV